MRNEQRKLYKNQLDLKQVTRSYGAAKLGRAFVFKAEE